MKRASGDQEESVRQSARRAPDSQKADEARRKLIEVAIPLFANHGFDAVSTGDVARAAGLSQPMVHYYFGNKENLWKSAIVDIMQKRAQHFPMRSAELKDLDPLSRLKVLTRRYVATTASNPYFSRILAHESALRSDRMQWLVDKFLLAGFSVFDEALKEGMETGQIKKLPLFAATNTIVSAASYTITIAAVVKLAYDVDLAGADSGDVNLFADTVVEILFNGLAKA